MYLCRCVLSFLFSINAYEWMSVTHSKFRADTIGCVLGRPELILQNISLLSYTLQFRHKRCGIVHRLATGRRTFFKTCDELLLALHTMAQDDSGNQWANTTPNLQNSNHYLKWNGMGRHGITGRNFVGHLESIPSSYFVRWLQNNTFNTQY